ncbi:LacI family DNA-binding transcriptional regulator [Streptomyces sp. 3MP-14]|uniref:LacI family DNA-binding transcriptional regulator n=1 Tax=Streptomyces mimosae TaxID=2586635 RepID=A0A5N6A6T4_9ACTN|nr:MULTISPECIES: LacI family DNA-binding transcriptional regulator [Streptomyces]KAB8164514.1 LacI family DNA-binding transcriptional regulator [Streptomyces mimosae]KAB8175430.1 LacI family DNA-binding transcriptional regulator [Streptomyces sp. 3MP-14]
MREPSQRRGSGGPSAGRAERTGRRGTASVTSHDVARSAGVSQATVSRALRSDPSISAKTREKVLEAARVLGYVPNELGRSLSTRATRRIALVADLDNPLWPMLVGQIHDELAERGYSLTLLAERGDPVGMETQLLSGWADGVIITSANLHARLPKELAQRRVPFVLVNRTIDDPSADAAVADNAAGGRAAAQLLLEAGHTRLGALFGPTDTSTGQDRERGFREALAEAGVSLPKSRVVYGPFDFTHGRESLPALLRGRYRPTAVFCANDIIAIGAINTAHELGLRVPEDIALVGFDDLDQASWPVFNLTTIKAPFDAMLGSAVSMLVERLSGYRGKGRLQVHPIMPVLRGTHGPDDAAHEDAARGDSGHGARP